MSDNTTTPFSNKASILAELWMNHRHDVEMKDFVEYNDLGLPLAYAIAENVVAVSDKAKLFIEETFDVLVAGLGLEDTGFDDLATMLSQSEGFDSEAD
jgi:hypothetical protein